ncbi:MAG: hypothetical protein AAGJ79_07765 [Verrucomicrobiota bacterium]
MSKKLCDWSQKKIIKKRKQLEDLIRDPRFLCAKCARAANEPRVLCKARRAFFLDEKGR